MNDFSAEALTAHWYRWEMRGRGWDVWNSLVELEPPFEPFVHAYASFQTPIDDGSKPTFLSSLVEELKSGFRKAEESSANIPLEEEELIPAPFENEDDIIELGISLPHDRKIPSEYAEQLLLNLGSCNYPVSYEIVGASGSIQLQIACREPDRPYVESHIRSVFPDATIEEGVGLSQTLCNEHTVIVDFGLSDEFMRSLKTFQSLDPDPLLGIIAALDSLSSQDTGLLQVIFQSMRNPWAESILHSVTDAYGDPFFADAPEMVPLARKKIQRPLYAVVLRIIGQSSTEDRAWEIARSLASGISSFAQPTSNELIPLSNDGYDSDVHFEDVILRQSHRTGTILNSEELMGFVHFPSASVQSRKLKRKSARKTKSPPAITAHGNYVLGKNLHEGKLTTVNLSTDQRLRHIHVLGSTGTGKSTLLLNLICQDIKAGIGVCLCDPHGDLIDRIIEHVPENRFDDVILFDPGDTEYPVGFNILQAHSEIEKTVLSSDLVGLFQRFATSWGDQMTTVLGNAIAAMLEYPEEMTLIDLRHFLIDGDFRRQVLHSVSEAEIRYFWEKEYPSLRSGSQNSILTRLDAFLRPKIIRNIVGEKAGLDLEEIVRGRKILLVKLAQGVIGEENSHLLGSLLVSKLYQVIMARQVQSEREPFFLYLDEFQNFITQSIATMLVSSRKMSLGLVAAHQDLRQLFEYNTALANSVITNPATRICFRLGDFDAEKMSSGFSFFDSTDLQNLGVGEAIARVERKEYDFNLKTFEMPHVASEEAQRKRETIIARSRAKYGHQKREIQLGYKEEPPIIQQAPISVVVPLPKAKDDSKQEIHIPTTIEKPELTFVTESAPRQDVSRHRYLQTLIKKMAEQRGYRAVIEEPTSDGGRVDVGLERDGRRIACEISVTTGDVQELHNIEKCLRAGYDTIIVCSSEKKNLEAVKRLVTEKLPADEQSKVLFFEPEELFLFLDEQLAQEAGGEQRIKGYRVKVQYRAVSEADRKRKREAVAQVVGQALRRLKKNF